MSKYDRIIISHIVAVLFEGLVLIINHMGIRDDHFMKDTHSLSEKLTDWINDDRNLFSGI